MEDAFTAEECAGLVAQYADLANRNGRLVNGQHHDNIRRCDIAWLKEAPDTSWVYQKVARLAATLNTDYFKFALDGMEEELLFISYDAECEGFYDWHVDRSDNGLARRRKLSITIQLSDGESYDGGDLLLNADGFTLGAPRQRGNAIAFPGYCLHRVNPVVSGTRHALVVWVHGPDFT